MDKKYIIGIDSGSQSSKVVIYDLEGNIICDGKENLKPMYLAEPGIVEYPDDDLWDSICIASKKAMAAFPGKSSDIIGVGLGSIRCCRVLLKKDGTLAAPVISWMDQRVSRPYEHTNKEVAYVTTTSGYLSHRLTGEFKDNAANYYGQWPIDFTTWQWSTDEKIMEQFQIPRDMLFDVQMPGTILGKVTEEAARATGFPVGLPVASTTSDKAVEGLGAGLIDDSSAVVSLGTYITLMISGKELPKDPVSFWAIMSSMPNKYLYESYGIRRGMWTVSWFRDLLGDGLIEKAKKLGISPEDYLSREAEAVPPGSDGLMTILDWLANPWEPFKKGVMIGFNAHMNYAYMYRSILEGIAFTMKNNCSNMCQELNRTLEQVIISGGGSNSDLFMQIFADVFNLPAKRNAVNGSASIGAAINTAIAVGVYQNYEEAVKHMVKVKDTFMPIPENVKLYDKLNKEVYQKITQYTDEVLKKSYAVLNPEGPEEPVITGWSQATGEKK